MRSMAVGEVTSDSGKWKNGPKPAQPLLFNFEPHPDLTASHWELGRQANWKACDSPAASLAISAQECGIHGSIGRGHFPAPEVLDRCSGKQKGRNFRNVMTRMRATVNSQVPMTALYPQACIPCKM